MAKTYKVWVHVEEFDSEKEEYDDVGLPVSVGEYDSLDIADGIVESLTGQSINK